MGRNEFNIEHGGDLTTMGASWFVSYAYWLYVDSTIRNWERVQHVSRKSAFNRSKEHHVFYLEQVMIMSESRLNTNKIGLSAKETKQMANKLLEELS